MKHLQLNLNFFGPALYITLRTLCRRLAGLTRANMSLRTHQVSGRCILVAEDDENDVYLLLYAFRKAGIEQTIKVVSDGQQVLDYLSGVGPYADRREYPFPVLVLLDLKLLLKSGLEVLEWIRSQPAYRTLVVIMFTASAQPSDVHLAYSLGANSFVVKPSDLQQRAEIARYLKGWWLDHNTYPLDGTL